MGICRRRVSSLSQLSHPRNVRDSGCVVAPSLPLLPDLPWKQGAGWEPSPDTPPEVARTHCGWHRGWPRVCSQPGALCAAGITRCSWGWPRDLWGHLSSPSPLGTQTTGCPQGSQPSPGVEPKAGHFLFLMLSWFLLNQVNNVGHWGSSLGGWSQTIFCSPWILAHFYFLCLICSFRIFQLLMFYIRKPILTCNLQFF